MCRLQHEKFDSYQGMASASGFDSYQGLALASDPVRIRARLQPCQSEPQMIPGFSP